MTLHRIIATILLTALAGCQLRPEAAVPTTLTSVQTSPWQTPFGPGTIYHTIHYSIYCTAIRPGLASVMPGFMEAAYRNYSHLTGLDDTAAPAQLPVYLVTNRRQWIHLTRQIVHENLEIYLSIDAGGYCYRGTCVFWDIGGIETLRLASHEGLHQFLSRNVRNLPIWLEEGLCVCAEGIDVQRDTVAFEPRQNVSRLASLRSAIANRRWRTVEQLVSMDAGDAVKSNRPGEAVEYYAQLWALVLYLQSQPQTKLAIQRIIADAAAGRLQQDLEAQLSQALARQRIAGGTDLQTPGRLLARLVFSKYITSDFSTFDQGYYAFSRALARL